MQNNSLQNEAVQNFQNGKFEEAVRLFSLALEKDETSELWNDWATVQFQLGMVEEAEEGYRRALELDANNISTAMNLGVLLKQIGRAGDAISWLEKAATQLGEPDVHAVRAMIEECRKLVVPSSSPEEIESYLLKFAGKDDNEKSYLKTHLARYTKTLELLPQAAPGQTLLELGAAFHHITPALKTLKGYEVRCSDVWEGEAQVTRDITSVDGAETHSFVVDNFDIERFPWPYPDRSFDVVMCCEMMEHLITDPMGVINEINRVLKPAGRLLVTTPNMASAKSVEYALRGESPYIYGRYEPGGRPTDHHNREYTTNELERLLELGGFQMERIFTHDSWWSRDQSLLKLFASRGLPIARRGDNTLCLAKRVTATADRYPEEFYLKLGTQATRRDLQAGDEAIEENSERPLRILIANEMLPQTDRNGSDVRLMQIIEEMCEQGHEVTYLARNGYLRECYTAALEELGVKIYAHDAERLGYLGFDDPVDWTLEQVLAEGKFDLAVLLLWFWTGTTVPEHYIPAIRAKSPNTRIAVLTDDQHGLRELRMAELQGTWADFERSENYSARELEVYRNADIVLSISEDDRNGLLARDPKLNISLLPMMAELTPEGRRFSERDGILFLGNFSNAANKDGVQWIMQEVWPRVHAQLPDATLSLAGSNFPEGLGAQQAGIKPIGHVPDLKPLLAQHKLFVCPIRFGTGIKTKNLSALGSGLPLVTTTIGAEGMNMRNGEHALIADSVEDFANAIVAAYTNENLWRQLSQQGRKHISVEFGHKRLQHAVSALVQQTRITKPQQSTKYEPEYLSIEQSNPEIITYRPSKHRNWLRLLAHATAANKFLAKGNPARALAQLRHIFSVARDGDHAHVLFDYVLDLMARCYRQLGNTEKAQHLEQQKRKSESSREIRRDGSDAYAAKISVIIPTHNRSTQLKICLANLAAQSLPAHQWELIIVDDGSTDNTKQICSEYAGFCNFEYIKQQHSGIGAALQTAAEHAKGEYLLFIQDDTILSSSILADHLRAQYELNGEKAAVVGSRAYPPEAAENALNLFVAQHPLFFMQSVMPAELQASGYYLMGSHFSIAKKLLLEESSFDPSFEIGADIELAIRLHKSQCRLFMRSDLRAEHLHLSTSVEDLVNKAERYGAAQAQLFRKYPSLVGDGTGAYGKLDTTAIKKLQQLVKHNRQQVREHMQALEKVNAIDLRPLLKDEQANKRKLEGIMQTVKEAVPVIYWTHFFARFLETWNATKVKTVAAGD